MKFLVIFALMGGIVASNADPDWPDCEKDPVRGPCDAYFFRYYYEQSSGICKMFTYGSCGGNKNNFQTEDECYDKCGVVDEFDCGRPPKRGPCDAYIFRYFYDHSAGMCKIFTYGGCGGNKNNFHTEEECNTKCGAHRAETRNACDEDKEVGSCKAAFTRFYFNKKTGQCEPFIYGGCQGNSNNFLTLDDCKQVCTY